MNGSSELILSIFIHNQDIRHFNFYTGSEKYLGSIECDARQTFKLPAKLKNTITGQRYSISSDRDGDTKVWRLMIKEPYNAV